jgi:branched-chain amino acid transport system ATP-binding protein
MASSGLRPARLWRREAPVGCRFVRTEAIVVASPESAVSASSSPGGEPLLRVLDLSKRYGGLLALSTYTLDLQPRTIHAVIGPNGAGKTTLFNLLSGMVRPTTGSITLAGEELVGLPAAAIARKGVVRTFQNIRLFGDLSVLDNVMIGVQMRHQPSFWRTMLSAPSFRRQEAAIRARAGELLALVGLADRAGREAASLPYGDQRRLEIVRALAVEPRVLMLDEPNAGMNPSETEALLQLIRRVRDQLGITIILIAHDIPLVMNVADRIQVLNFGSLIAEGDPATVRTDPEVVAAYIGQARHA